jgi:mediator of RNA polymerase II transcription subunit 18
MECVVEGFIEAKHVDALEVLLQGLCGSHRETVKVHEICLKTDPNLGKFPCSNLLSAVHVIV